MAGKQVKPDPLAGPFHSFKVVHVTRPGGGAAGSSEVTTGHLCASDAVTWIYDVVTAYSLAASQNIHPAHGIPWDAAEALGLEGTGAASEAAAAWEQGQLSAGPEGAAEGGPGGSEADGLTS